MGFFKRKNNTVIYEQLYNNIIEFSVNSASDITDSLEYDIIDDIDFEKSMLFCIVHNGIVVNNLLIQKYNSKYADFGKYFVSTLCKQLKEKNEDYLIPICENMRNDIVNIISQTSQQDSYNNPIRSMAKLFCLYTTGSYIVGEIVLLEVTVGFAEQVKTLVNYINSIKL